MRFTIIIMTAAALAAAVPAAAQDNVAVNADTSVVSTDPATVDENAALAGNVVVDNSAAMDVMPIEEETAPATAPAPKKSFPWGLLGLIGLVGLIGRKR